MRTAAPPISLIARRLATTHVMGAPLYRQHLLRPGAGPASTADGPLPISQTGGQAAQGAHSLPAPAVRTSRAVAPATNAPAGATVSSAAPHNAAAALVATRSAAPPLAEAGLPLVQGGQLGMALQARYLERPAARLFRPLLQLVAERTPAPIVVAAGQLSAAGGPATPPVGPEPSRQELSPAGLLPMTQTAAGLQRTLHEAPAAGMARPLAPPVIQPVVQLTAIPGDTQLAAGSLVQAQKPRGTEFGAATGDAVRTDRLPLVHGGRQGVVQRTGAAAPSALQPAYEGGLKWSVSQPSAHYPATASAIVQRADAQGPPAPATYPAAPSGMAAELGGASLPASAVDDAQLERMADKVYRIIEQRLIIERESMGM